MTLNETNRRLRLTRRSGDLLSPGDVEIEDRPIENCGDGQILLRRIWLSADPTTLARSHDGPDQPAGAGYVVRSNGLSRVIESRHPDYEPGMWAGGIQDWEEWSVLDGDSRLVNRWPRNIDPLFQLAVLNGPGPTAYFGLVELARVSRDDTVLVSRAAGPTGSLAVQVAQNLGASVIGIAETEEQCRWVEELGAKRCVDLASEDLDTELRRLRPRGVDVFFDTVGGQLLDTTLRRIADGARVVLCGAESAATDGVALTNHMNLVTRGAIMYGLKELDFIDRYADAQRVLRDWYHSGELDYRVDVADGLESYVDQVNKALAGTNTGKTMVRVAPDPGPGPY